MEANNSSAEDGRRMNVPVDILPAPFLYASFKSPGASSTYTGGFFFSFLFFFFWARELRPLQKWPADFFSILFFRWANYQEKKSTGGGV